MPASINNGNNNSSIWKSSKPWLVNYASLMNMPPWLFNSRRRRRWQRLGRDDGQGTMERPHIWTVFLPASSEASARYVLLIIVTSAQGDWGLFPFSQLVKRQGTLSICKHDKKSFIRRQPWPALLSPNFKLSLLGGNNVISSVYEYIFSAAGWRTWVESDGLHYCASCKCATCHFRHISILMKGSVDEEG